MAKLPHVDGAFLDLRKIAGYLLSETHPKGRLKAAYFLRFGFSADKPAAMAQALLNHDWSHDIAGSVELRNPLYCGRLD